MAPSERKFFNKHLHKEIVLQCYEELCPICYGNGNGNYKITPSMLMECPGCFGKGKFDWIEIIKGVVEKNIKLCFSK